MKLCKTQIVRVCSFFACLFFLATVPAFAQHGNIGIDVGETADRFGNLARHTDPAGDVNGEVVVHGGAKESWPYVLAGGEIRFPSDTNHHTTELAVYGGIKFAATKPFSAGFHVQVRKIYVPSSTVEGQVFNRNDIELLEIPLFVEYKFGPSRHVFIRAEGAPEFRPRFRGTAANQLPNPGYDHGYFVRGSLGYNFGKWYAKGAYETRYLKYTPSLGNPLGLNNWRSDLATVGVGLNF